MSKRHIHGNTGKHHTEQDMYEYWRNEIKAGLK